MNRATRAVAAFQHIDPMARLDAAYQALGQVERATENFTRLIDLRRSRSASPDQLAQALRFRGAHYVRTGRWTLAAADYTENAALDPMATSLDWMAAAALWAYAADVDQHRLCCQAMARFRESNDPRTVKVSLLLEQSAVPDPATVARFLEALEKTKDPALRRNAKDQQESDDSAFEIRHAQPHHQSTPKYVISCWIARLAASS